MVDFPGNRPARALAYCGLGFNGAVLITLGTLVAPHPWVSVALMFVLGVAVTFAGALSEIVAAGQRATLLMFVLPACTPVGPLQERLLGWLIALAICVPAALFLFPPRHHDELRADAARVCNRLADRLEGTASAREVTKAMNALDATFLGVDYRPVALTRRQPRAGPRGRRPGLAVRPDHRRHRSATGDDEEPRGARAAGLGGGTAASQCRRRGRSAARTCAMR